MTIRSLFATACAALVLSAAVAPTVEAATMRRPARAMAQKPMNQRQAMMSRQAMRGGDAQNADVDRLNAQSLATARGGR